MHRPLRESAHGPARHVVALLALVVALASFPLAQAAQPQRLTLTLQAPDARSVSVQVLLPEHRCEPCDLIVFSHGAYAAPERYDRLLLPWAQGGYIVAAPLHPDSELYPDRDRFDGDQTRVARVEDFALLAGSGALATALAPLGVTLSDRVVATGHSYGALIAQVVAGATLAGEALDSAPLEAARARLDGVVALSPPGPFGGVIEADDWASVQEPMLVVTGTTDILPGFVDDWRTHLVSFESASSQPSYALVYEGQDHYFNGAFGRPSDDLDEATTRAMASLNAQVLAFLQSLRRDELPTPGQWRAGSNDIFEARVTPSTEDFFIQGAEQ